MQPLPDAKFWERSGPWCVLAVIAICATAIAAWKIYNRMAKALDEHHASLLKMSENHTTAIERMNEQLANVIRQNTEAFIRFENRLKQIENHIGIQDHHS